MPGISEVGACNIDVKSFKCSIEKITVSTKWEGPNTEVKQDVTVPVFDPKKGIKGRTLYIISSPEGQKVTIKTERTDGQCNRDGHKKYMLSWKDFEKDNTQEAPKTKSSNNPLSILKIKSPLDPYVFKIVPQKEIKSIAKEEKLDIKCFEVGGAYQALLYFPLPVPIDKNYCNSFTFLSCKDGSIPFNIISYPDISFSVKFAIGTDAVKSVTKTSKFEKSTKRPGYVKTQLRDINTDSLAADIEFKPSLTVSSTYNKDKDKLELTFNFDKEKEFCKFKYKHDKFEEEYSSALLDIPGNIKKIKSLCNLISKISKIDFLKEFTDFDSAKLVKQYKPFKLKLGSPNVVFSYEGKYQNSRDLTRIGKYIDFGFSCEPLLSLSFTVDLLYLIISAATAGTGTGFYVMLKNLDKVIEKILGREYKKDYKNAKPFEANVYFDFVITGKINGGIHWIIDTSEEKEPNSSSGSIEGVLKVDLKAGAKVSLDVFIVSVEGEASASGSTGIMIKFGLEDHMLQGRGFLYTIEGVFLGITIKYCIKGKVGLMKTKSYGGSLADGEAKLMKKSSLFRGEWTIFEDNTQTTKK